MKYDNELRTGDATSSRSSHRALQFAHSDPKGPVYLTGAREVMEEETAPVTLDLAQWQPISPAALPPEAVDALAADAAAGAASAGGHVVSRAQSRRRSRSCDRCAARLGIGVLESVPSHLNFPTDDPLYQGNQWNQPRQNPALAEADLVLVLDSDVPWIPAVSKPAADAAHLAHRRRSAEAADAAVVHPGAPRASAPTRRPRCVSLPPSSTDSDIEAALLAARRAHYAGLHAQRAGGAAGAGTQARRRDHHAGIRRPPACGSTSMPTASWSTRASPTTTPSSTICT